ncbi:lipopolysaccharide heptosyltransferase II [Candidatus Poribacteria bacterium]|nr:lipopolysaccharide heptosyltransferase II [Candidatus Poribacteria bacterium]
MGGKIQFMKFDNINKILIIRNDGIGDLLNSTPAISALRKSYNKAKITVMAKYPCDEILFMNPDVDNILVYTARSLIERIQFLCKINRENYDMVVVLQNSSFCNFIASISCAKYRIGSKGKRFSFALTHKMKKEYSKGQRHEIQRNLDLVEIVGAYTDNLNLVFQLSEEERNWSSDYLRKNGIEENDKIIGIHPGGSSFDKLWPVKNFALVADSLVAKYNARILIFNGPQENDLMEKINGLIQSQYVNISGVSLRQFADILQKCSLFICNDSGPMHIAAALRVPTVAIFGPTDYIRWKPHNDKAVVVRLDTDCWPCSAHKCNKDYECIKALSVEKVLDAAVSILD